MAKGVRWNDILRQLLKGVCSTYTPRSESPMLRLTLAVSLALAACKVIAQGTQPDPLPVLSSI